jgi:hypothetical protein
LSTNFFEQYTINRDTREREIMEDPHGEHDIDSLDGLIDGMNFSRIVSDDD